MPEFQIDERGRSNHDDMAFFGAITASITHELNNVLSIIDQTAGLLDDLLYGVKQGKPLPAEKLQSMAELIDKHAQRGFEFIRNLNKFAHSVDSQIRDFELVELIKNFTALTIRFANLKQVEFKTNIPNGSIPIRADEFKLQQLLFISLKMILDKVEKGDLLEIGCTNASSTPEIWIKYPDRDAEDGVDSNLQTIEQLAKSSGWRVVTSSQNVQAEIRFSQLDSQELLK